MTPSKLTEAERFAAIYQAHGDRVMAYALRHVGVDAAEEVVAETFLVAWRRLRDVPGQPLPWLIVVARNTIANQRRSHYRQARVTEELTRLERVASQAPSTAATVEERSSLLRAVIRLSPRDREALLLVAWDGLSTADAAVVAGCSTAAFHVRLHRARRRFQRELDAPTPAQRRSASTTPQQLTSQEPSC